MDVPSPDATTSIQIGPGFVVKRPAVFPSVRSAYVPRSLKLSPNEITRTDGATVEQALSARSNGPASATLASGIHGKRDDRVIRGSVGLHLERITRLHWVPNEWLQRFPPTQVDDGGESCP